MTLVNSTCANGASAIGVPGWPFAARSTASIASPRITLIDRCSSSASLTDKPFLSSSSQPKRRGHDRPHAPFSPDSAEEGDAGGEGMHEVLTTDGPDLAGAERARQRH